MNMRKLKQLGKMRWVYYLNIRVLTFADFKQNIHNNSKRLRKYSIIWGKSDILLAFQKASDCLRNRCLYNFKNVSKLSAGHQI